jgi:hypothetical protein
MFTLIANGGRGVVDVAAGSLRHFSEPAGSQGSQVGHNGRESRLFGVIAQLSHHRLVSPIGLQVTANLQMSGGERLTADALGDVQIQHGKTQAVAAQLSEMGWLHLALRVLGQDGQKG